MLKRFLTPAQVLITLLMFAEVSVLMGLAVFPGVSLWLHVLERLTPGPFRVLLLCMLGAAAYFLYGIMLTFLVPLARWVTFATGVPTGTYPYVSFRGYQWASYNALILIMRYSFVNWIRATPFIRTFYRLMGMKIGARRPVRLGRTRGRIRGPRGDVVARIIHRPCGSTSSTARSSCSAPTTRGGPVTWRPRAGTRRRPWGS